MPKRAAPIDELLLKHLYVDRGWSTRQLARYFGVSRRTIVFRLRKLGVTIRTPWKNLDPELVKHLYVDEGLSTREIAKLLGISNMPIRLILKRLGVMRNKDEAVYLAKSRHLRPYDGDPATRVELLALRLTDFTATKSYRRIEFSTSTTHAGMIKFAYQVCRGYTVVRCYPQKARLSDVIRKKSNGFRYLTLNGIGVCNAVFMSPTTFY